MNADSAATAHRLRQVASAIEDRFSGLIETSDAAPASPDQALRTRGLAALAIQILTAEDAGAAAACVTDGYGDYGIDAVYVDDSALRVILVQSKWRDNTRRGITVDDALKFVAGVRAIMEEQYDRFGGRLDGIAPRISAVIKQVGARIDLVLVTTSTQRLSGEVVQIFDDERRVFNTQAEESLRVQLIGLDGIHEHVLDSISGKDIDITATIEQWGVVQQPYEAYYGTITASQIADWYQRFGERLFDHNIRKALGRTQVNRKIVETLLEDSPNFWYFNNGITILCGRIGRAPVGVAKRLRGELTLYGVSVVNGAQTVASIAEAAARSSGALPDARVWIRVISLEKCPQSFASTLTRANNTQNQVIDRDFVALEPQQLRLQRDFALTLRKVYAIKRGEETPAADDGCAVEEATIALACAHPDARFAVLAHSNPGSLWDLSEGGRHDALFHEQVSAIAVWRWVCALRRVEQLASAIANDARGRDHAVAKLGNRLAAHIVFSRMRRTSINDFGAEWQDELDRLDTLVPQAIGSVTDHVNRNFSDTYVSTLFKNIEKCRRLAELVKTDLDAEPPAIGPVRNTAPAIKSSVAREEITFYLMRRGVSARGHLMGQGFVVEAGSFAARDVLPSLRANPSAISRRAWLVGQGVLRESPEAMGLLVLVQDEYFESPSQASAVLLGGPSNGRTDWRTAAGASLNRALADLNFDDAGGA